MTSLVVLGGVCVAAFVAVRVLGRFLSTGRTHGTQLLDVVARVPLEPRRSLYVVDVAGKTLLVGTSEMGLSVLTELDRSAVQSRVVPRPTFADLVKTAWQKRRAKPEDPAPASATPDAATPDVAAPDATPPSSAGSTGSAGSGTQDPS